MHRSTKQVLRASAIAALAGALLAAAPASDAFAGKFKVVHSFCSKNDCKDGEFPLGPLRMDASGNLFGVTKMGGRRANGELYELARQQDGSLEYVSIFGFELKKPEGGVVIDNNGNFYGELSDGTFYKVSFGFGKNHDRWGM